MSRTGRRKRRGSSGVDGPVASAFRAVHRHAGHQMGFNDLKVIEAHELLNRILGRPA